MNIIPKSKTIFIVDDDIDDQDLFMEALREIDGSIQSFSALNGEEAINILNDENRDLPDFIFLDLNLPRLNGKQCLAQIKSDSRLRKIPVIIYSTSSQQQDIEETMVMGASLFVTKPCNFKELCAILSQIVLAESPFQTVSNLSGSI